MADKNKKRKTSSDSIDNMTIDVGNPTNDRMTINVGNPTNDRMFDTTSPRERLERELSKKPTIEKKPYILNKEDLESVLSNRPKPIMETPSKGTSTIFGTPTEIMDKSNYSGEALNLKKGGVSKMQDKVGTEADYEEVFKKAKGGMSVEDYAHSQKNPHAKKGYSDGGEIHITKGHDYIKDLLK